MRDRPRDGSGPRVLRADGRPPPPFRVTETRPAPGRIVLHCSGEVDLLTVPDLCEVLGAASRDLADGGAGFGPGTDTTGCLVLVADLSGVTFFGASALGALLALADSASLAGVALVLRTPSRAVTRILELTGTARHFHVEPTLGAVCVVGDR